MTTQETAYAEIKRLKKNFKDMPSVRREDNLDRVLDLEREIVRVVEEIDKRVYMLYGLTKVEIGIIEGKEQRLQ